MHSPPPHNPHPTSRCPPTGILSALRCSSLDALSELLGPEGSAALADLQALWRLAEGYGYADWLVFDASVVRGLAYYTGRCGWARVFVAVVSCVLLFCPTAQVCGCVCVAVFPCGLFFCVYPVCGG